MTQREFLQDKGRQIRLFAAARAFFASGTCLQVLFIAACSVSALGSREAGTAFFCVACSLALLLTPDPLSVLSFFLLAACWVIRDIDAIGEIVSTRLVLLPASSVIAHLLLYRRKASHGPSYFAMLAVSAATALGGLGFLPFGEYFASSSVYYVLGLGFGMLLVYCQLSARMEAGEALPVRFARIMTCTGMFASFLVLNHYAVSAAELRQSFSTLQFAWRNDISTILMLTMPFSFWLALKNRVHLAWGAVQFVCLILSGSRGGLVFGTLEFLLCVYVYLREHRQSWKIFLAACCLFLLLPVFFYRPLVTFLSPTIERLARSFDASAEPRLRLYGRAVRDFLGHPFFGTGLGYTGNSDIYQPRAFSLCYIHCAPLQILSSLGLAGAAAYGWQFVLRCKIFLKGRTSFGKALFLAFLGAEMMSLVNPGVLAPIPYLLIVVLFTVAAEKCAG